MKVNNFKYKALALGLGAAALLSSTSCSDFLDGAIYDQTSADNMTQMKHYRAMLNALYGGRKVVEYDAKFNWVFNEGASGNLYNTYQDEGTAFKLQIKESNGILAEGFRAIYGGIIATANRIINMDMSAAEFGDAQKAEIIAEAKLMRAYAHFMATEYWGAVPVILNTDKSASSDKPLMSRATVYAAVEKDLKDAEAGLPETPATGTIQPTKWAAKGLLAKLYLTMAACKENPKVNNGKDAYKTFNCSQLGYSSDELYEMVINLTTEIINSGKFSLATHKEMFGTPQYDNSPETILAWHHAGGGWGQGSQYQCQMAREGDWSPGAGWGGGKGVCYTLYKDFNKQDARLVELAMYANQDYYTVNGTLKRYGSDLMDGIGVLNNIKKFVWGAEGINHFMAHKVRFDIVRLSQVYMMRQEAKMLKGGDYKTVCSDMADLNDVLSAHNAKYTAAPMAFYTRLDGEVANIEKKVGGTVYKSRNGEGDFNPLKDKVTGNAAITMYHTQKRADFIQELRKEFAMEGQNWFDLKRLYYMTQDGAYNFLKEQDRSCYMVQAPDVETPEAETDYARQALVNDITWQRMAANEDGIKAPTSQEEDIDVDGFHNSDTWFLPFPTDVDARLHINLDVVEDKVEAIKDGSYPY